MAGVGVSVNVVVVVVRVVLVVFVLVGGMSVGVDVVVAHDVVACGVVVRAHVRVCVAASVVRIDRGIDVLLMAM